MNTNIWVIINSIGNYMENIVVWDGDGNKWTPPNGTYATKMEDVDFSIINENPENEDLNEFVRLKKYGHAII
jgi:hypothetical protein